MTKFYINGQGKYLGGFDGALPPAGAIEVAQPPSDGRQEWDGKKWVDPAGLAAELVKEKRKAAYLRDDLSTDALIVALWEKIVENKSGEADRIQAIRSKIKSDYPNP